MSTLASNGGIQLRPEPSVAMQGGDRAGRPTPSDSRPIAGVARQFNRLLSKRCVVQSSAGAAINSAFPVMKLMQTVTFPNNILIKRVDASLSVLTDSGIAAVYLVEGTTRPALLNLTDLSTVILGLTTPPPVNPALAMPITRVLIENMLGEGLEISSGAGLSVYMASSNSANNIITAVFNISYENIATR